MLILKMFCLLHWTILLLLSPSRLRNYFLFFFFLNNFSPSIELKHSEILCYSFQKSCFCPRLYIRLSSPLFTFIDASCSAFGFMNYLARFLETALSSKDFRVLWNVNNTHTTFIRNDGITRFRNNFVLCNTNVIAAVCL